MGLFWPWDGGEICPSSVTAHEVCLLLLGSVVPQAHPFTRGALFDARWTTLVRVVRRPRSLGFHARSSAGTTGRQCGRVLEESLWPFALQQMSLPDASAVRRVEQRVQSGPPDSAAGARY
jgi:hypothetical protein